MKHVSLKYKYASTYMLSGPYFHMLVSSLTDKEPFKSDQLLKTKTVAGETLFIFHYILQNVQLWFQNYEANST